jgi:hypothetical protein
MFGEAPKLDNFVLNALQDTVDFRDLLYTPTLVEVPTHKDLDEYKAVGVPIRNQGGEGACTGFGLATVANYLLRTRKVESSTVAVSPRMLYEMAKRYDEWQGEKYSGSSARGAMKGWHKHGVCTDSMWPYKVKDKDTNLTHDRAEDARGYPLGAYFRVNHKDLIAMHAALAEVGILYATASIHDGWRNPDAKGIIKYSSNNKIIGGHAFAIVAYDKWGFWIQNSWSDQWGNGGFARISYDEWLENSMDVWVARLGVPVEQSMASAAATRRSPGAIQSASYSYADLRPHVVSLGNDGLLNDRGEYGTSKEEINTILEEDIRRITNDWEKVRILLYAHGGLVGESTFLQRVAEYRSGFLENQVYPLAMIWHTDLWSTITNIINDASKRRHPAGVLEDTLDFMLDRFDETLEAIVRGLNVRGLWDEMKENANLATTKVEGGARFVLDGLAKLIDRSDKPVEIHMAGHSAGSIFLAPAVQYFTSDGKIGAMEKASGLGKKIATCALWAPAICVEDFYKTYYPAIQSRRLDHFSLYTLTDEKEQDDNCANLYHKSLLYMVSNALEKKIGEPLLGMERFVNEDEKLTDLFKEPYANWVKAPKTNYSNAKHHGDFDDDVPTVVSTLADIIKPDKLRGKKEDIFNFKRSAASLSDRRRSLG